ncbi:heterokaryon incompatibility protein-domain-containing protein [Hypoxylon crocopeplum]|nr:heterokaryon incompatibility protein-domain-containing protein [Hypoxylon crocopeplum]
MAVPPEYWAMELLDHKIGHGLFEIRPGHHQHPDPSTDNDVPDEECAVCHRPRDGRFEGVVGDLKDGMARGCRLCDALHQVIVAITQEPYQLSHPFQLEVRKGVPATLDICVATVTAGDVYQPLFAKYQLFFQANATKRPKSLHAFDSIGFGSPVASNARSIQCLSFVRSALNQCLEKHADCGQSPDDPELPTRVLDLGDNDSQIKLLEPKPGTRARYAALSHCWGARAKRLETKQATLETLKSTVPWADLPPTFQDAADVARCLGLRYLWIDSLCIVQDSAADWEVESSRMAGVYRDASVTIAAVSSASSDDPFLKPRNPGLRGMLLGLGISRAEQQMTPEELGLVAPQVESAPFFALGIRPLAVHATAGPLSDRAWTFQEEKLSSRILRFSETELSFECRRGIACECDMYGAEYNRGPSAPPLPPLHGLAALEEGSPSAEMLRRLPPQLNPFLAWQSRVAEYSKRKLTFASDKLPALAGLATICHTITKSAYLAGIWRDHFVLDLLWHPTGTRTQAERPQFPQAEGPASWKHGMAVDADKLPDPSSLTHFHVEKLRKVAAYEALLKMDIPGSFGTPSTSDTQTHPAPVGFVEEYRAPTWSWASVDCPIEFRSIPRNDDIEIEVTVVDAQCTVNGLNPFGRVSDGYVLLRGPLIQAQLSTRPLRRNYGSYLLKQDNIAVEFKPDLPLALDSPTAEPRVRRATSADDQHGQFQGVSVWCLSLIRSRDGSVREVMVLGLSARVPGAYERLGLISASTPRAVQNLNHWFRPDADITSTEIKCV